MPVSHTQEQNNGWIGKILKKFNIRKDGDLGCQAIVDKNPNIQICGNKTIGQMCRVGYCSKHTPSGSAPGLVRMSMVEFYCPNENKIIQKE